MAAANSQDPDVFLSNKNYPDAQGIFFDGYQTLEEVKNSCLVVLDTNVLLVPYGVSKNGLAEIESTYNKLAEEKRLFVPGQVAREFAKHRPLKIGEIFQAINRKNNFSNLEKGRNPLLEDVESYKALREVEEQISNLLGDYRKAIADLLEHIKGWSWNDPVSRIYSQLFPHIVVDPALDEKAIKERLEYQNVNKVPPGYKDGSKTDQGVGDLLVWQAALQVAETHKLPVVLVSGDSKADWFHRSEGQTLYPRFELVDEIRRVSDGKSLHIISFSKFLELFGANSEAVVEARTQEVKIDLSTMSSFGRNSVLSHMAEQAVSDWLEAQYPFLDVYRDNRFGSYVLAEKGGATCTISVKYFSEGRSGNIYGRVRDAIQRSIDRVERSGEYDNCIVFLVFEAEESALQTAQRLPEFLDRIGCRGIAVVIGYLPKIGGLHVHDPLNALPSFE